MSTTFNKNILPEFDSIKDSGEDIIWSGKPIFIPYALEGIGKRLIPIAFGVIWILVSMNSAPEGTNGRFEYFSLIGLIPIAQGLYPLLNKLFSYPNTIYAYSNKRVMIRTGFMGTDFKIIDYDKISDIEITVNMIERMYDVGTIRFFSGRTKTYEGTTTKIYDKWLGIKNPYEIFKLVKQTSLDIKTDIHYPNALRPETNTGYRTKYEREQQ
ncbi:PH domain-containing protein [Aquimarina sp. U1-2]|uniref:PH domain-containing protein n=1 Tax=Aquimarina sp. U1-2 TaxID=2823141 RepID=UPI001AEC97BF|nr:PH domain-containing protein [Aquimarina sp. U1-2]MBP2833493.1 PH domain-containing protein [Aquimarina sp. U1-2]